jgi:uncharacterized protein
VLVTGGVPINPHFQYRLTSRSDDGPTPALIAALYVCMFRALSAGSFGPTHKPQPKDAVMPFTMSKASIPVFEIGLTALSGVLDKGVAFATEKKIEPGVLLASRLSPDMLPLTRQVQIASDQVKNGSARLAGVEAPRFEDNETTFDELKARLEKTIAYVKTLDTKAIDSAADREITFPLGPTNKGHMKGDDYLNHFMLPNFYFHLTTAYAILRHCGVDIGKRDFLGAIPIRMT